MEKIILQAKFDEMVDRFDGSDSIIVEDVNREMRRCWREFLEAGFDAKQVAKMMSRKDRWKHYDVLLSYGVSIDATKMMLKFGVEFVKKHWDEFVERGVSADALVKKCFDNDIDDDKKVEFLLEKGASAETVFELAKGLFKFNDGWPERWSKTFSILRKYGLSVNSMVDWLNSHVGDALIDDIIEYNPDVWKDLGVNVSDYVDLWIERHGEDCIYYGFNVKELPELITLDKIVDSYSMKEILEITESCGFDGFIDDYVKAGGDVNVLAKKFIDEIGYSKFDSMFYLVFAGATNIDIEKFVNSCEFDKLDELDRECYYTDLKNAGIDEAFLSKFLPR